MISPFFSIIIPTYAHPESLAACLQSLTGLEYPRDRFEVIIVDDGSNMPPERVIAPFQNQLDVALLTQPHAGPAAARNCGAATAQGNVLAFLDDDCVADAGWLAALAAGLAETRTYMLGGRTINRLTRNPYSAASQALITYLYSYYNADPNQACFFASNNIALPAAQFNELGGFDAGFVRAAAEDRDFCDRWLARGYGMRYTPEAVIYHTHNLTLRAFWWQHFNYGRGAFCFHEMRARRDREHVRVEPLSFYLKLLSFPFAAQMQQALLLAALLGMSQFANAAGFFCERANQTNAAAVNRP